MISGEFLLRSIGIFFSVVMIYVTFIYFHKQVYSHRGLTLWSLVWVSFAVSLFFPGVLREVADALFISRILDLLYIGAFIFIFIIIFMLFVNVRRTESQIDKLVSTYAKDHPKQHKK